MQSSKWGAAVRLADGIVVEWIEWRRHAYVVLWHDVEGLKDPMCL